MSKLAATLMFVLSAAVIGIAQPAAAEPPPVAAFFKRPALKEPKLSPSGRYLAVLTLGRGERTWLAVLDLDNLGTPKVVASFANADVYGHQWLNDERLVFHIGNSPDGSTRVVASGLWAVDRDGGNYRQLIQTDKPVLTNTGSHIADRRLESNWKFHSLLPTGSDEVLVARSPWSREPESTGVQLARLDTRTGALKNLSAGLPDRISRWVLDWQGEPKSVESVVQGRSKTYLRAPDGSWKLWQDVDQFEERRQIPYWFGPDGQTLVMDTYRGFNALFRVEPTTLQREAQPVVRADGYSFQGSPIFDPAAQKLLGLHIETDAPGTVWLDPAMKALQADIDAKLPGSVNRIECRRCLDAKHLIVTSISDQRPPVYLLYRSADRSLQLLAGARPDLTPADMGQRDYHRIKARDGLELPVLVTQAAGPSRGPRPAVLLVHGGPWVRGTHWPWEPRAQFLASRGYVVLEPEFRGSTGYGFRHFQAGWKQWGLAMQDDLADTVAWAVKQGWVDPNRVCIAGASYGGYAALMGAVKQGDVFKCAINWVGVTDIDLKWLIHWSDVSEEWKQYGMKKLVGDPEKDAEQFKATSPLLRAQEIKMPLLMAYGAEDRRVPLKHGTDMKAALAEGQPLEWVVYPDEGHGWFNLKTNEDFWGRVERFLAKHIGPAAKP